MGFVVDMHSVSFLCVFLKSLLIHRLKQHNYKDSMVQQLWRNSKSADMINIHNPHQCYFIYRFVIKIAGYGRFVTKIADYKLSVSIFSPAVASLIQGPIISQENKLRMFQRNNTSLPNTTRAQYLNLIRNKSLDIWALSEA